MEKVARGDEKVAKTGGYFYVSKCLDKKKTNKKCHIYVEGVTVRGKNFPKRKAESPAAEQLFQT